MEYFSTSNLANSLDIKSSELFEKLKILGWIERRNEKWLLTDLGEQKGGQVRISSKFGEYIVWPENISFDNIKSNGSIKLLNATSIGRHYNVSSQRLNLILSELGWIEKAYVGQDVNGWSITKLGRTVGGRQLEHESSGANYVLWPENILHNKSLEEVFFDDATKGNTPTVIKEPTNSSIDYREKFEAKHRTLDGHYVRSRAEVIIDNLLYQYGLVHAYERKIIIGDVEILSDFYLPAGKVYIEFWGLEGDSKYDDRKKKKLEFYKKNDIPLIELSDKDILNLDDHLPRKLKNHGIKVY